VNHVEIPQASKVNLNGFSFWVCISDLAFFPQSQGALVCLGRIRAYADGVGVDNIFRLGFDPNLFNYVG
jgi:hypothetical protein